ncbi:MAG TPA: YidB family protein [Devosia sp.]|nr:YidB family protein [Devosia sp.]
MAKNAMPSMLALLGLLAVAGYQNRDKLGKMIGDVQDRVASGAGGKTGTDQYGAGTQTASSDPLGGLLDGLGDLFGMNPKPGEEQPRGVLTKGLDDLMSTFRNKGQAETADSWVTMGVPTKGLSPSDVEQAIGDENLTELARRTGLSREDLLDRLATAIPETVDRATPDGYMPASDTELRDRLSRG